MSDSTFANVNESKPTPVAVESKEQPNNSPQATVRDVPTWLHCLHYPDGAGQFTKRAIHFNNPETGPYTIPCVVCPECLFAALTPYTVCAGVGRDPMPEMQNV